MASVHRKTGRPFWFCAYRESDGRRVFKSAKTGNKKQAEQICRAWEKAANLKRLDKLTPERAREIIAEGVANVFAASGETLPSSTTSAWIARWLAAKELETEPTTFARYNGILKRFLKHLNGKQDRDLSTIRPTDVQAFRDGIAKELSRASANVSLKVLRMCLGAALKQGILTANPAVAVDTLKTRGENKRRPFTLTEIKKLLKAAKGSEWEGMILFGIYTGQRLGDLARLTWQVIDLEKGELSICTRKTGRRLILPLAKPLQQYLEGLPSTDDPKAPVFPTASALANKRTGTLSNQFYEILAQTGLVVERSREREKDGRNKGREVSELSFHSLRHTATTLLKAAGASDVIAREIIGHDSEAISRGYTHLGADDLRQHVNRMPDVRTAKA